jgi:hypothetical protein
MQVLPDAVIINLSPSQRKLLRDPRFAPSMSGLIQGHDTSGRGRISVADLGKLLSTLRELRAATPDDPDRHTGEVLDQLVLKIDGAAEAQRRAYGAPENSN